MPVYIRLSKWKHSSVSQHVCAMRLLPLARSLLTLTHLSLFKAGGSVVCGGLAAREGWCAACRSVFRYRVVPLPVVPWLGVEVAALLSALVGWAHLSLKKPDLWSQWPASHIASVTELWKSLSIAHWPNWITSSAVFRARFLNGWFKAHSHTHARPHARLCWLWYVWLFIPSIYRGEEYCLLFHSTLVLMDFWLSFSQYLWVFVS